MALRSAIICAEAWGTIITHPTCRHDWWVAKMQKIHPTIFNRHSSPKSQHHHPITDPLEIAYKELREKKIPFTIRRYLPDNTYEDWSLSELLLEEL